MDWFRHYNGLYSDPKLGVIAKRADECRGNVIAIWCAVLESANSCDDRGSTANVDAEEIAVQLDMDTPSVERVLAQMEARGLIVDGRVAAWERRQHNSDSSAERTKRWRERQAERRETGGETHDVTPGDVTVTSRDGDVTARTEQNRVEQNLSIARREAEPDGFDAFWSAYPRKVGKGAARKAWLAAIKRTSPADILAGLAANATALAQREAQFVPHAATWLRAERWNDPPEPPRGQPPTNGGQRRPDGKIWGPGGSGPGGFRVYGDPGFDPDEWRMNPKHPSNSVPG